MHPFLSLGQPSQAAEERCHPDTESEDEASPLLVDISLIIIHIAFQQRFQRAPISRHHERRNAEFRNEFFRGRFWVVGTIQPDRSNLGERVGAQQLLR